ncbi:DUF1800 domain-containing protein [Pelagimonas varians]|uniref:DUF1800 domain-containing protein n=1 Tax=Pelagimonas varians TaxID=696760 RepID=A0A238L4F8_9RHOB|nr:DUF1800 domain-containing protein [Pelagimonas varians]PYG26413.1 uncharacterized protein (DUF1800 family) [Pelagimonas varians]SMX49975.1 hypothetical protein PEV8663_04421 [Pelagimonas varians]
MTFDPITAEIRFGCGLSPKIDPPSSVDEMLDGLVGADKMSEWFRIPSFQEFSKRLVRAQALKKQRRMQSDGADSEELRKQIRLLNKAARQDHFDWLGSHILRRTYSETPFRERLEGFWADHFTAAGKGGLLRRAVSPFVQSAIRPNMAGAFEDLLIAAVTHPLVVHYLDQVGSTGPNSIRATNKPGKFGLNENLAREILELHTLGVAGPYTQTDVRELAELLTGLTSQASKGRQFKTNMAEPGSETVLGKSYSGSRPDFGDIEEVLRDLARHPATARHMAGKLAVHFVSDTPDPALVDALERTWRDSDGNLSEVYGALLKHPAAWWTDTHNVKKPFEYISSAARALAIPPKTIQRFQEKEMRQRISEPLRLMGHIWQKPSGPDGLEEADGEWLTPQGVAARLQWAVIVPQLLMPRLPDPREFVDIALGGRASEAVRFAASAAESRAEGVGLVLISPAFQRM